MRAVLLSLALSLAFSVIAPSAALADGCGSAGDSQYFDPLQNCNTQPPPTHTSPTPPPVTSYPTTPAPTVTLAASHDTSSKSLPFTGLNLAPVVVVAVALLGGGLVLRRVAARDD